MLLTVTAETQDLRRIVELARMAAKQMDKAAATREDRDLVGKFQAEVDSAQRGGAV